MRFVLTAFVTALTLAAATPGGTERDRMIDTIDAGWGVYYHIRHHWFPTADELTGWAAPWRFPVRIIRLISTPETANHEIAAQWWRCGAPRWMIDLADPTVPDSIPDGVPDDTQVN